MIKKILLLLLVFCIQTGESAYNSGVRRFDGNDIIEYGDTTLIENQNAVTMEAWIYIVAYPSPGYQGCIMGNHDNQSLDDLVLLVYDNGVGIQTVIFASLGAWAYLFGTYNLVVNRWYHVAGTANQSTDTAKLYIDGNFNTSTTGVDPFVNRDEFAVGGRCGGSAGHFFNGYITEARLYHYEKSALQIKAEYQNRIKADNVKLLMFNPDLDHIDLLNLANRLTLVPTGITGTTIISGSVKPPWLRR